MLGGEAALVLSSCSGELASTLRAGSNSSHFIGGSTEAHKIQPLGASFGGCPGVAEPLLPYKERNGVGGGRDGSSIETPHLQVSVYNILLVTVMHS